MVYYYCASYLEMLHGVMELKFYARYFQFPKFQKVFQTLSKCFKTYKIERCRRKCKSAVPSLRPYNMALLQIPQVSAAARRFDRLPIATERSLAVLSSSTSDDFAAGRDRPLRYFPRHCWSVLPRRGVAQAGWLMFIWDTSQWYWLQIK